MHPELHIHDDVPALVTAVAQRIIEVGNAALAQRGLFHLVLAGGATPKALYQTLGSAPLRQQLDWSRVHLWFGDERAVPPDHADSNYRMAREALIDQLPIPATQIHRMEADLSPVEAASRYAADLAMLPTENSHFPVFDLILLGLGADGHVASLFPNSEGLQEHDTAVIAHFIPQLEKWRITLTLPVLNAARHLLILVSGDKKADVIRHIFCSPPGAKQLPVQLLAPTAREPEWFIDQEAARYLHREPTP